MAPMSWGTALAAQDQSLEDLLARRQLDQNGLMGILQQAERQRAQQVEEAQRERQLAETAAYRRAAEETRRLQAESLRDERAAREAKIRQEMQQEATARQFLEQIANDPNAPEHERTSARYALAGLRPPAALLEGRDRMGEITARSQANLNNAIALLLAREKATEARDDRRATADNPKLPAGVKAYLDTLPRKTENGQPYTAERARRELLNQAENLRAHHPNLDMAQAVAYLDRLFTGPNPDREVTVAGPTAPPPGMVWMRAPDGTVGAVKQENVAEAQRRGLTLVE
jgi:uncharacterized protein (UPF0147 family)